MAGPGKKRQRGGPSSASVGEADKGPKQLKTRHKKGSVPDKAAGGERLTIDSLPDTAIQNILSQLGFPHRFTAARVCRRWRAASKSPYFTKTVKDQNIAAAIAEAQAGDTVVIPPGFYQELIFVDKPLRLVGQLSDDIWGGRRRGVVLQNTRSVIALCNARCCIQNVVMRTTAPVKVRSICCFGPDCPMLWLQNCEIGGFIGVLLPFKKDPSTCLVMLGCHVHGVPVMPAIAVETGHLRMEGCTITSCGMGVAVDEPATAHIANNDISFNQVGIAMHGRGTIRDNVVWGNLSEAVDLPPETLHNATGLPAGPTAPNGDAAPSGAPHASQQPHTHASTGTASDNLPRVGVATFSSQQTAQLSTETQHPSSQAPPSAAADAPALPGPSSSAAAAERVGPLGSLEGTLGPAEPLLPPGSALTSDYLLSVTGNHVKRPARSTVCHARESRKQVRRLIHEVYGGDQDWNDWHVVNASDIDTDLSDDDSMHSMNSDDISESIITSSTSSDDIDDFLGSTDSDASDSGWDSDGPLPHDYPGYNSEAAWHAAMPTSSDDPSDLVDGSELGGGSSGESDDASGQAAQPPPAPPHPAENVAGGGVQQDSQADAAA